MHRLWLIAMAAAVLAAAACAGDEAAEQQTPCLTYNDCPQHYLCNESRECVPSDMPCDTSAECPFGYVCVPHGICIPGNTGDGDTVDTDPDPVDTDEAADLPDTDPDTVDNTDGDADLPVEQDTDPEPEAEPEQELPTTDSDNDGIPDALEDRNGNGHWDLGETDLYNPDTDDDGVEDGAEDANQNGIVDPGEMNPTTNDSDSDGIRDGVEDSNHNGQYDPGEDYSNPLNFDTDGDGLSDGREHTSTYTNGSTDLTEVDSDGDGLADGAEDRNGNGTYEPEEGETDPTMVDSDGDGVPDNQEGQAQICQPDQIRPVTMINDPYGKYSLAIDGVFNEVNLLNIPGDTLNGSMFNASVGIAGFLLSRQVSDSTVEAQRQLVNDMLASLVPASESINHRNRVYTTYDGYPADTSRFTISPTDSHTIGSIRDWMLAQLSGVTVDQMQNTLEDPGNADTDFEIIVETMLREEDNIVIHLATIITSTDFNDTANEMPRIAANDLTNGTAISIADNTTLDKCDPFASEGTGKVDFLWLIDPSGSMNGDKQAVMDASEQFFGILESTGFDFRIAVTSMACVRYQFFPFPGQPYIETERGLLAPHGFTNQRSEFTSDLGNLPCSASTSQESGLEAGWWTIHRSFCGVAGMPCFMDPLPDPWPQCPQECLRTDAALIVVFLSDEEEETYKGMSSADQDDYLNNLMVPFYTGTSYPFPYDHPVAFSVVGDIPSGCVGPDDRSAGESGSAYIEVSNATGGGFGSICSVDMTPTFDEIVRAAASYSSSFNLNKHPISSTIQVTIEGQPVARSYHNGFEYDAVSENVVFYGNVRPVQGDEVIISYRFFSDDIKGDD